MSRGTIADDKKIAESMVKKHGHEMGKWSFEYFNRWYWCICKLCNNYVYVRGGRKSERGVRPYNWDDSRIGGTAIKYGCTGIAERGKERRKYTIKKKKLLEVYSKSGIEGVIEYELGKKE